MTIRRTVVRGTCYGHTGLSDDNGTNDIYVTYNDDTHTPQQVQRMYATAKLAYADRGIILDVKAYFSYRTVATYLELYNPANDARRAIRINDDGSITCLNLPEALDVAYNTILPKLEQVDTISTSAPALTARQEVFILEQYSAQQSRGALSTEVPAATQHVSEMLGMPARDPSESQVQPDAEHQQQSPEQGIASPKII